MPTAKRAATYCGCDRELRCQAFAARLADENITQALDQWPGIKSAAIAERAIRCALFAWLW
jgi:hypothetical protein